MDENIFLKRDRLIWQLQNSFLTDKNIRIDDILSLMDCAYSGFRIYKRENHNKNKKPNEPWILE